MSLIEETRKRFAEQQRILAENAEKEEEKKSLARRTREAWREQYEAGIREAMLGSTLREEASEAQKRADRFDNERTTLWDVISPSNVFKAIRNDGENEVGLTKQSLSAKTFGDWQRDKERLTQLKAEAEEKQQLSAAYAAQKRQERAEAMTLDELNQKINAPGAENDPAIGEYRKAYDRKKSTAETEKLPKKVLDLLDRYNAADTQATADAYASILEAFSGQRSGKLYSARADKQSIGQELESMGYSNYKDLAAYRKKITDDKNAEKQTEEWSRFSNEHPVAAAASARLISPTANITGVVGVMKNKLSGSPLLTGNDKSADFALKQAQRTVDENISQSFKDSKYMTAGTKAFLYQTGMSGIDSLGASLFGKAGGALLGGGAMTDAYLDAIEKGKTGEQAFLSGVTAGVAETLFETISLGQLNALKEIAPKSFKDVVKNIAKSTFTNFTEEANTEIANIISDYLISGGLSDYAQQYQAYKDGGLSDGDAKKNTVVDLAKRVGEAGLGGALMGGAFGTVGSVAGKFNYEQALKQSGADVARNSGEERLLASAYELGSDENTVLSGYAQSVEQNMKALEQSKAAFEESQSQVNEGENTKKEGKKQEKAPEYTSKQLREIGHLQEELAIQTDDTVKQKAESAVENRLSELGEEKGKIDKAKSAIVKSITGEKLTAKDKSNIKNSKYGQRVLNEFSDAARSYANAGYSSKWAAQLQGEIEGVYDSLAEPDIEAYRSRTTEGRPTQSAEVFSAEKNADSVTDGIKMSSAATETMNKIMDEGQNADDYERSFKTYYQMGKSGYTLEEAMSSKGGAVSADFTDFQKRSAFELGQTALRTQKQVKLSTVSKIADNAVFALDENGNEVNLDEVDADGGQKMLFNRAALLRDVDAANTFISGYKPGVGLLQYSDSFRSFFNAGKQNSGKTFDSFLKENSGYKSLLSAVDEKTARSAFERGAAIVREAERKKAKVPAKKARKKEGSFVNNTIDTELNEVYEAVSKKLGIDIEKTQSLWTADEREANAQFIAKEMKVLISADAESEFTDTVHELGHLGEVRNKSAMQKVRQAILDWHNEVRGYNSTEDAISRFMQEYDCSREDAIEEYTNEALAGLFSTDEGVQDFMEWLKRDSGYTKKEKKTVLQKIIELFDRLVESIRKIISEGELSFAAKDFAQMQADRAAQIRKMFLDALEEGTGIGVQTAEPDVKYSKRVTDKKTLDFLKKQEESGDVIVTYKSMQIIDGKLYSPMAAKVKGEDGKYHMTPHNTLGVWQQAVEDTSNIKVKANGRGYYTLNKGNGKSIDAAYNPYEHSSNMVLNDQFEEAYKRPNLVTVECIIPKSEMTSGYRAQYAKDSTGFIDWKAGVVAGKLTDNQRKVYLSRWLKPVRIVPDSEVAQMYKTALSHDNISVPFNVVTPSLLDELEKADVPIDYEGTPLYKSHHKNSAEETKKAAPKHKPDVKYSIKKLSDGTKYVKLDGDIFVDDNGNEMSPREAYNNLVGLPVVTDDGEKITLVKRLLKGKDMYNEFFKRWATFEKGVDIKSLNTEINKNIIEVLTNSTVDEKNVPDVNGRHSQYGIVAFDTRNVIIADDNGAYNLKLSIAVLTNGRKIGYAKKRISKNVEIWQKIKKATSMSESQFSKPSINSISQNFEKSQEKSFTGKDTNITDSEETKNSLKRTDSEGTELSAEQQEFFKDVDSSLRDDQGRIKPFYHGTARADRVGYFFDPERATSGPMAFFTDNKQIADNYARDKNDTSLAYDSDYDSYETQFRVNVDGESIPVSSLWYYLNVAQKNEITQKAQQLTIDDDYEDLVMEPGNKYGNGGFDIRYARGNAIQALIDSWLGGGFFIGEENRFLDVLKAVGINDVEYKDPNYREEKTYKAYLNIKNPFNTDWVDEEFISDLKDYVENTDMSIYEKESASADMWDKNSIGISDWIERLQEDYENGTTYSWTSIPDVVTDFLKEYGGYDGIIDRGGKQGGEIHTVAIPFYSNQIKEITNKKPTAENPETRFVKVIFCEKCLN